MSTDSIADYLTRVRNAIGARKRIVEIPASGLKKELTRVLHEKGYISKYKFEDPTTSTQGVIKIALKYDKVSRRSAITQLVRISKPGLRKYSGTEDMPRVLNGMGVVILSTSRGVMTDKEAREQHVGGEVLCYVY